ncbi:MAG: TetR/AcrR family transcriptional regulator [Myxococcota bacterium]
MGARTGPGAAGRPREFDLDAALDTALELFWQEGFGSTSTRTIATRVGVSQSSLYNAFGSKQELLAVAMERYEARITASLIGPLEQSPDGSAALEAFIRGLGQWLGGAGHRGCMLINLMAEDGGATDEIARRTRAYRARLRSALMGAITRGEESGEFAPAQATLRADLLLGLILGMNIAARGGASGGELDGMVAAALAQLAGWKIP